MPATTTLYKIAEAARLSGVSASTLRLWEAHGLLIPRRSESGQRQYTPDDIASLKRISWLRSREGLNVAAIRAAMEGAPRSRQAEMADKAGKSGIGRKLRELRRASGKTLHEVAQDIGLSSSALSTFERTSKGIAFKTLHELASYFGTTVSDLSGERERSGTALVRSGEWRAWPETTPGVVVQLLAEGANQMDCHRFVLAPGASSDGAYRHEGEEFLHVLSGRMELVLDHTEIYDLGPGDSFYFRSERLHEWTNRYDGQTIVIWINTPPTF